MQRVGEGAQDPDGGGGAVRLDVGEVDAVLAGVAREGGPGQAPVLAPDPERAGDVDQPVGDGGGTNSSMPASKRARAASAACRSAKGEVVLGGAQTVVLRAGGWRPWLSHGFSPGWRGDSPVKACGRNA